MIPNFFDTESDTFFIPNICRYKVQAVEEMLKQTEEDADKEILEMKTSYEIDLKREAESNVKLRWVAQQKKNVKNTKHCNAL